MSNFYEEVNKEYPGLAEYLDALGIDIVKTHETMPIEVDDKGFIDYICAQYIVFGNRADFKKTKVKDVKVYLAESYPSTEISEDHFVIEVSPIKLRWVVG